jgi:hypothetical protein
MSLSKITGLAFKEEISRGFNILNGNKIEGSAASIKMEMLDKKADNKTWGRILSNSNGQEGVEEQIKQLAEEEYY